MCVPSRSKIRIHVVSLRNGPSALLSLLLVRLRRHHWYPGAAQSSLVHTKNTQMLVVCMHSTDPTLNSRKNLCEGPHHKKSDVGTRHFLERRSAGTSSPGPHLWQLLGTPRKTTKLLYPESPPSEDASIQNHGLLLQTRIQVARTRNRTDSELRIHQWRFCCLQLF